MTKIPLRAGIKFNSATHYGKNGQSADYAIISIHGRSCSGGRYSSLPLVSRLAQAQLLTMGQTNYPIQNNQTPAPAKRYSPKEREKMMKEERLARLKGLKQIVEYALEAKQREVAHDGRIDFVTECPVQAFHAIYTEPNYLVLFTFLTHPEKFRKPSSKANKAKPKTRHAK